MMNEENLEGSNCSVSLLDSGSIDDFYGNGSLTEEYVNCSEVYGLHSMPCNATDYLCFCAKEMFLKACPALRRQVPKYYSYIYRIIGTSFQGLIFTIGVIGNVMVVLVVGKNKSMKTPTNCYLVSLAVADCVVLVAAVPQEIVRYFLIGNQWIWGKAGCAILIFLQQLGINASSLSLTAFTVERYIAICHPMKAQTVCTLERANKITVLVWSMAVLYCSPWLFLTKVVPLNYDVDYPTQECTFKLSRKQYLYYYFMDFLFFYVIPLLLSCVLYGLISRILFTSHVNKSSRNINGRHDFKRTNNARVQVVKMLAVVVAIFATLWLPYRMMLVYNSLYPPAKDLWYLLFAKTCIFINSAINPILYNALSVKFRRAFKRMLCCGGNNYDKTGIPNMHSDAPRRYVSHVQPCTDGPRVCYPHGANELKTFSARTRETSFSLGIPRQQ